MEIPWIPAFAGMTSNSKSNGSGKGNNKMDSSVRWNDGDLVTARACPRYRPGSRPSPG